MKLSNRWVIILIGIILGYGLSSFPQIIRMRTNRFEIINQKNKNIEVVQKISAQPIENWSKLLLGQNIKVLDKLGIEEGYLGQPIGYVIYSDKNNNLWVIYTIGDHLYSADCKITEIHGPYKNLEKAN